MTKEQRKRYEMFVRVRNFGAVNRDVFPESSEGGQAFTMVAEAVTAFENHLTERMKARADARRIRTATRRAVVDAMKAIAATGRRAAKAEPGAHPFRMPRRHSAAVVLSVARLFMAEAERRRDSFVKLGMPPTFLTDFHQLIGQLEQAVNVQQDSRGSRLKAQTGIEDALARGFDTILDLDVTVANALRGDAVRLAQWQGARHVEGQTSASRAVSVPAIAPATTTLSDQPAVALPAADADSPPAPLLKEVLDKAS